MGRMRRRVVGHGAKATQGGGSSGFTRDQSGWNAEYLAAFHKARKLREGPLESIDEAEAKKVSLLVGGKAEKLGIDPKRAGKLASMLCEDIRDVRIQMMMDLIANPNILEAARTVWQEEGKNRNEEGEEVEEEVEEVILTEGTGTVDTGGAGQASPRSQLEDGVAEEAEAMEGQPEGERAGRA